MLIAFVVFALSAAEEIKNTKDENFHKWRRIGINHVLIYLYTAFPADLSKPMKADLFTRTGNPKLTWEGVNFVEKYMLSLCKLWPSHIEMVKLNDEI